MLAKVRAYLGNAAADPSDPAWRWCAEYVTGYSKAKPAQAMKHSGDEGLPVRFTFALGDADISDD